MTPNLSTTTASSRDHSDNKDVASRYHSLRVLQGQVNGTLLRLCEDCETGDLVVVKTTPKLSTLKLQLKSMPATEQDGGVTRFVTERDSMHQEIVVARFLLTQPLQAQTIGIIDTIDTATYHGIVMEYSARGDLFSLLEQQPNRRFDERLALTFFRQMVHGVNYLHSLGIAHRDISLKNILLDEEMRARICDFGLSTSTAKAARASVGKLLYMAPEVAMSSRIESGSTTTSGSYSAVLADIWSLGIALFVMLTGSPLFAVAVPTDPAWVVMTRIGVAGILSNWGMADEVSPGTVSLLSMMLQMHPAERVQSTQEVMDRLDNLWYLE